jgi:NAD(P)-dependent dehydrogenase (short-subunit alcohol dehydrogenase family)
MELKGKTAVVSGASHGLGLSIVKAMVQEGMRVHILARSRHTLFEQAEAYQQLGADVIPVPCDISNAEDVARACDTIMGRISQLDVLINNAGVPAPRSIEGTGFADWDYTIGVNLSGAFYLTRGLWDCLKAANGSYVINVSSEAGVRGSSSPAYAASKFGMSGLTHATAASGQEHGIRVSILYPGSIDTGWRGTSIGDHPAADVMNPDDVAAYILFLLKTPQEFVIPESVLTPFNHPWM